MARVAESGSSEGGGGDLSLDGSEGVPAHKRDD